MSCRKALNHIGGAVAFVAGRQVKHKALCDLLQDIHVCVPLNGLCLRLGNCYFTAVNTGGK
jgi:hypothetical protein